MNVLGSVTLWKLVHPPPPIKKNSNALIFLVTQFSGAPSLTRLHFHMKSLNMKYWVWPFFYVCMISQIYRYTKNKSLGIKLFYRKYFTLFKHTLAAIRPVVPETFYTDITVVSSDTRLACAPSCILVALGRQRRVGTVTVPTTTALRESPCIRLKRIMCIVV